MPERTDSLQFKAALGFAYEIGSEISGLPFAPEIG